jgi:hypothetical protein
MKHDIQVSNTSIGASEYLKFVISQILLSYFNLQLALKSKYLTDGKKKKRDVRLFGLEIYVRFVLLALFPSRSVSAVCLLCIILTQNSILIRCSDTPSCCANWIWWVTSEVFQTTVNWCTLF